MAIPDLSVIVASFNSKPTIADCLNSLCRQETGHRFEVIVVDSSNDGTEALIAADFPEVRLIHFAERKYPGDARNVGIAEARAEIVASIDADCIADKKWVAEIMAAHQDPALVVGGAIANAVPRNYVGWTAYFCEFSEWMPGAARGWRTNMATANISYKRSAFRKYGRFIEGTYGSDTDFNWRLGREGHRILWIPEISVSHQSIESLGQFIRHEFHHGKDCSRMRIVSQSFSAWRRGVYAACFMMIPIKLFALIACRNLRHRTYLGHFLKTVPLLIAGLYSWCLGELVAFVNPKHPNR
jgi:glycosyltransferase involved in cell wall biosynthesis